MIFFAIFVQFMWTPPTYQYVLLISNIIFSLKISFCSFCKCLKNVQLSKKKKEQDKKYIVLFFISKLFQ